MSTTSPAFVTSLRKNLKAGHRYTQPMPHGSGDAALLAQLVAPPQMLTVVCAQAADAQRLLLELKFFAPGLRVHQFPDWETLPYDTFSPHQDLISERLATLYQVMRGECDVLLVPASTALTRLAPPAYLAAHTFFFKQGETLNEAQLRTQLTTAGYSLVSQVMSPGEYSVRGGLIDLFPMGSNLPYRLDLLGDEIETIRTFDPDTQRSLFPTKEVRLLPGREFPLDETSRTAFRGRWRETFEGDPSRATIYKDIGSGIPSAGIEYYLPLFFEQTATLFDYLPEQSQVVLHGDTEAALQRFLQDAQQRFAFLSHDRERPVLPTEQLFLSSEQFFSQCNRFAQLALRAQGECGFSGAAPVVAVNRRAEDPLAQLKQVLQNQTGRTLILGESAGRRETLHQYLAEYGVRLPLCDDWASFLSSSAPVMLGIGPLLNGFIDLGTQTTLLTESELYAGAARRAPGKKQEGSSNIEAMVRDLSELRINDPVVHAQHGIGRYLGLVNMNLGDGDTEFLHLEYANQTKLYVPVSQLHVIGRYSGSAAEDAPLHALGSGQWEKAKRKAAVQARDSAAELLNLYARRAAREGFAFQFSQHDYEAFSEGFGFEETPDQAAAIEAVIRDMASSKPMDRLVCGDVGFGKTEVALRAAFIAVAGGKQVAMLCPTTLLTEQHFQTFSDRFSDWPIKVVELSRFRSQKEVTAAIKAINEGSVDIVIGTHKLLSKDVKFARLGLVMIDEEHRFGVRQKEAFKALRAEVDVLALTATPIPRTLAMSMEGLREFSVIATAPQKRLAIKTFVRRETDSTIREAVLRELKRGGQVYFLHNEVDTIDNRRASLQELLPEARICIAHGQMAERDLERVMRDFYQRRFNILLCTTIIETGIDVPTANTILIHRSDKFGLAQLHQLRGRVGRSHHQAYAYLLVHSEDSLTKQAEQRLNAIQSMEELGSGFYLAMHDLEIRGAGEVLGEGQSGNMQEIGFEMYAEMLARAVKALRKGHEPDLLAPLAATTEINLHLPALLPNDYCGDVHERLSIYKRLASCTRDDHIDAMQEELIDRFGKLPEAARALIETHRLRLLAEPCGIIKIDASEEAAAIQFDAKPPIEPMRIIDLIQKNKHIKLAGQDKLRITARMPDLQQRVQTIKSTIRALH
ncbi:MAG: transcription-repair coupling factor [Burkholderiaceae bacterium]|nr:MAG: transcription-repair coupling factor [Burkholderiaceae bacterium]